MLARLREVTFSRAPSKSSFLAFPRLFDDRIRRFILLLLLKVLHERNLRFKIQGQILSGGTTFSEYPNGRLTLLELTWLAH